MKMRWIGVWIVLATLAASGCGLSSEERRDGFYEKGVAALAAGKTDDARLEIQNALRIDPKFAKGYVLMGDISMVRKDWQKAYGAYARAEELDANLITAKIGLAKLFLMAGQLSQAKEKADQVLAVDAGNFDMRLVQALLLTRDGAPDQAVPALEKLGQERPDVEDIPLALADIRVKAGQRESAVAVLEKGLAASPNSLVLHARLGALLVDLKRPDQAEGHFRRLAELSPENDAAQLMLVRFYLDTAQASKAKSTLDNLIQAHPTDEKYRLALAQLLLADKDLDGAEQALRAGIAAASPAYDLRLALAELLLDRKASDQAEAELNQALALDAEHPRSVDVRLALARLYAGNGALDRADAQIEEALRRDSQNPKALAFKGKRALQQARPQEAITAFRQVLKLDPDDLEIAPLLARAHLAANEPSLAKDVLRETLKSRPDHAQARQMLAELHVLDKDFPAALAELEALASAHPEDISVRFAQADLAARMNDPKRTEDILRQVQAVHPERPETHLRLARFLAATGRRAQAGVELDKAEKLAPASIEVVETRVALLLADKKNAAALSYCDALLAAHATVPYLHELKGRVLATNGDMAKAEQAFERAIALDPKWLPPYYRIGELYLRQGRTEAGIAKFEEAVRQQPQAVQPRFVLALLNQMNNRPEQARAQYEALLERDPEFMPAMNNLAYLLAEHSSVPADLDRALALARKVADEGSPEGLDTLGWVQFRRGDLDGAVTVFLEAWEKKSDMPVVAYHLAEVYAAKGDQGQARTWIRKALDGTGDFPERNSAEALDTKLGR